MVPGDDRPCANCGGFHANPMSRNRTHWTTCVAEWDLVCQKSSEAYMELQRQRADRAKQATTIGHVATHIDGAPVILDYSPAEMAMAHATVLASRVPRQPAAYAAPPTAPATLDVNYAGMHQVQGQPDTRRFESYGQRPNTDTDYPGFSVPWNHYNSYMMCVEESEGPTDPTMPHLLTSFGTTYEDVLTTRTETSPVTITATVDVQSAAGQASHRAWTTGCRQCVRKSDKAAPHGALRLQRNTVQRIGTSS